MELLFVYHAILHRESTDSLIHNFSNHWKQLSVDYMPEESEPLCFTYQSGILSVIYFQLISKARCSIFSSKYTASCKSLDGDGETKCCDKT